MTTETAVLEKTDIIIAENYKMVLHNDNITSMEFVILLLMSVFKKDDQEAIVLTMKVHNDGSAVIAEYSSYEVAEQKLHEANELIFAYGYPLKITIEQ